MEAARTALPITSLRARTVFAMVVDMEFPDEGRILFIRRDFSRNHTVDVGWGDTIFGVARKVVCYSFVRRPKIAKRGSWRSSMR